MNDKYVARLRAEHNHDFGAWVAALAQDVGHAFRVLQRIRYGQPWDRVARRTAPSTCQ